MEHHGLVFSIDEESGAFGQGVCERKQAKGEGEKKWDDTDVREDLEQPNTGKESIQKENRMSTKTIARGEKRRSY